MSTNTCARRDEKTGVCAELQERTGYALPVPLDQCARRCEAGKTPFLARCVVSLLARRLLRDGMYPPASASTAKHSTLDVDEAMRRLKALRPDADAVLVKAVERGDLTPERAKALAAAHFPEKLL